MIIINATVVRIRDFKNILKMYNELCYINDKEIVWDFHIISLIFKYVLFSAIL